MAIVAALLVGVVGGGGVWAASRLSGGGSQPQDVLPADAIAYARLDLDPAAGQKLALFQIAQKFSATTPSFTGDDPKKAFFEALKPGLSPLSKVDYATDVAPWLGDRVGVAVLPPSGGFREPVFAVAVQVTDEAAAREGLTKLGAGKQKSGLAFRDGYAILGQTQRLADEYATAAPLASNPRFGTDLEALGEPGVASFWADLDKVASIAEATQNADSVMLEPLRGARFAGALRFDGAYAELAGMVRGGSAPAGTAPQPVKIGELPASTVAAASVSGLGDLVRRQWPRVDHAARSSASGDTFAQAVEAARQRYGLTLPDDLVTLLGSGLTVAVDERGLNAGRPGIGAVMTTDPAKARIVLARLERFLADAGTPFRPATSTGDGTFAVASTQAYADGLTAGATGAKLGDTETFKLAVPDAANANYVVYADLDKAERLYLNQLQGEERADVEALRAVGLSVKRTGNDMSFALRVVVD
jgi:Protein of unknown function (DUF3352)